MHALFAVLLMSKLLSHEKMTFWKDNPGGESEYVIKAHLASDTDRVCGILTQSGEGYDILTIRSGGAHRGVSLSGLPLDAAKHAIEDDCR